jgi:hypothetical protein
MALLFVFLRDCIPSSGMGVTSIAALRRRDTWPQLTGLGFLLLFGLGIYIALGKFNT